MLTASSIVLRRKLKTAFVEEGFEVTTAAVGKDIGLDAVPLALSDCQLAVNELRRQPNELGTSEC